MQSSLATRECWQGGLPCVFALHPDEVTTLQKPRPYTMVLPRQSLLPFVTETVRKHFMPFGPPMGGELWFEAGGEALRWQIPIGVLFDILAGEEAAVAGAALPWRITVHFQAFPAELLQATQSEAEAVLLNALKESSFLMCGSAMPAMSLTPASQRILATALSIPDADLTKAYESYAAIAALIDTAVRAQLGAGAAAADGSGESPPALAPVRAVPLRVFVSTAEWRQQPLPPIRASDGEPTTLLDALNLTLPTHFDAASGGADGGGPCVLVQGVRCPLHTPLHWLHAACAHPDGWLYVSVSVPTTD